MDDDGDGETDEDQGPGPCIFVDDEESVRLEDGALSLVADAAGEAPTCSEIISETSLGHGEYRFTVSSTLDTMDPNAVLGLFTYDSHSEHNHREIDVEISRWGDGSGDNAQFVVQPYTTASNKERFDVGDTAPTTHKFRWQPDRVLFRSLAGEDAYPVGAEEGMACWDYTGPDVPPTGAETAHINLWWMQGAAATPGARIELTLSHFEFVAESVLPPDETCTVHP